MTLVTCPQDQSGSEVFYSTMAMFLYLFQFVFSVLLFSAKPKAEYCGILTLALAGWYNVR